MLGHLNDYLRASLAAARCERHTLGDEFALLARLPAERFRQVHRASIVNLDQVAEALRDEAGRVSLRLKHRRETLPVSRLYAELFRQM